MVTESASAKPVTVNRPLLAARRERAEPMQLPDENIEYQYQRLLARPAEAWTPLAELQAQHFLSAQKLEDVKQWVTAIRGRVAAERELHNVPAKDQPLQAGNRADQRHVLVTDPRHGSTSRRHHPARPLRHPPVASRVSPSANESLVCTYRRPSA